MQLSRRLLAQIEDMVRYRKVAPVLSFLVAIFAALAALGFLPTPDAARLVFLWLAGVFGVLLLLALFIDRRRLYKEVSDLKKVARNYSKYVRKLQDAGYFSIDKWEEEQFIKSNGDTTIVRKYTLCAGPEPVSAVWTGSWMDPKPESYDYQSKTKISVFELLPDGSKGVDIPYSYEWDGHQVTVFIHFLSAKEAGKPFQFGLRIDWPTYAKAFLEGATVPLVWKFHRATKELSFRMHVHAPRGRELRVLNGTSGEYSVSPKEDGAVTMTYSLCEPPVGKTNRIDLQLKSR